MASGLFTDKINIGRLRNLAERGDETAELLVALFDAIKLGEVGKASFGIIHGAFQLSNTSDNENVGAFPVILKTGLTSAANAEAGPWLSGVIVKNFRLFGGGDQFEGLNTLSVTFDNGNNPAPVEVFINSQTSLREDLVSTLDFATVPGNLSVRARTTAASDYDLLRWSCEVHPA
jgi:hypothetical protein